MTADIIVRAVVLFAMTLVVGVSNAQIPGDEPIKSVRISGRVTDINTAPAANTTVKIKVPGLAPNTAITQTDENGSFTLFAVVPRQFELLLEAPGFSLLTVPVKAPDSSAVIDVGTMVLKVDVIVDPIAYTVTIPYDESTLPTWLKSEPGATLIPNLPSHREATTASRWQMVSCSKVSSGDRRIVAENRIVQFYIPPSAHLTEVKDVDYVDYFVQYGPAPMKMALHFAFGPLVGVYVPPDVDRGVVRWTAWRKWSCNGIEGTNVRGTSPDGRHWRDINIPPGGFAAYESVSPKAADYFDGILDTMCCSKPAR